MITIYNTKPTRKMRGVASTKFCRNGFSDGSWQLYHTDCLRFRKRAESLSMYRMIHGLCEKAGWINVGNNVITAPPCEVSNA